MSLLIRDQSHPAPLLPSDLLFPRPLFSLKASTLFLPLLVDQYPVFNRPFPPSPFPPWRGHLLALCQAFTPEINSSFMHPYYTTTQPPTHPPTHGRTSARRHPSLKLQPGLLSFKLRSISSSSFYSITPTAKRVYKY